ncbi:MAG: DEAD/DEAH box helicase [Phycisphaerae bacterium]|nr:DEAD/DEAH box helicase [Phycisphaerae bacterium]
MPRQLKTSPEVQEDLESLEPEAFAKLGLGPRTLACVRRIGFENPTEIQEQFIPAVMTGKDCVGRARTGTGKTAAFLLPIFQKFYAGEYARALILAPTRELAMQIRDESRRMSKNDPPRATAVYGGAPIRRQIDRLSKSPEIVAATPGRVLDHSERGTVAFHSFGIVVLDEVDRMFDMGFRKDIRRILRECTNRRQTMFLSATLPDDIMGLADQYLSDPIRISAVDDNDPSVETLDQRYFSVAHDRKLSLLVKVLEREQPELALIFTRTKHGAERLGKTLLGRKFNASYIHGNLPQQKRNQVMTRFRERKINLLVATDLMGRGIDVPGISHVINYDIPENAEDYLHRTGRSGRMNAIGKAFTFVTPEQGSEITAIEMLCNRLLAQDQIPGFDNGVGRQTADEGRRAAPTKSFYRGGRRTFARS